MLEKQIEAKVCDHAKSKGVLSYKFTSTSRIGVPDRIFIYKGTVFFVEFKREGLKPTPMQFREHLRIQEQGVVVMVIDNIDTGKQMIDGMISRIDSQNPA